MEREIWKIKRKLLLFDDKTIPLKSVLLDIISLAREYQDPAKDIITLCEMMYKRKILESQKNINQGEFDYGESENK